MFIKIIRAPLLATPQTAVLQPTMPILAPVIQPAPAVAPQMRIPPGHPIQQPAQIIDPRYQQPRIPIPAPAQVSYKFNGKYS
jgi:hypothetical protein